MYICIYLYIFWRSAALASFLLGWGGYSETCLRWEYQRMVVYTYILVGEYENELVDQGAGVATSKSSRRSITWRSSSFIWGNGMGCVWAMHVDSSSPNNNKINKWTADGYHNRLMPSCPRSLVTSEATVAPYERVKSWSVFSGQRWNGFKPKPAAELDSRCVLLLC